MHLVTDNDPPPAELVESFGPAMARKLYEDFKTGRNLRLAQALRDQQEVARDNAGARHHGVDGMGQVETRMATRFKYAIIEQYGQEALSDPEFMKRLDRENGLGLKPSYESKARIVHPGLRCA